MTTDKFLARPAGTIAYTDEGKGRLVLMVPGLGDLKEEYRFLVPKLVAAGYRAVTMDLRGHGKSSVGWPEHTNAALGSARKQWERPHVSPRSEIGAGPPNPRTARYVKQCYLARTGRFGPPPKAVTDECPVRPGSGHMAGHKDHEDGGVQVSALTAKSGCCAT